MKDETLLAVKEADLHEVPVKEIDEGANEERDTKIEILLQPPLSFSLVAKKASDSIELTQFMLLEQKFYRLTRRVTVVFGSPKR